jgi:predicted metalloprotease with PDZ domain
VPNARIISDFWADPAVNELPYQRGFLLAALWDYRVRQATKGAKDLDDVMLGMKRDAGAVSDGTLPPPVRQLFVVNMQRFGVDVSADISRFVEKGETIALPADVWAPCGTVTTGDVAEFDRGFDGRRTIANANLVTGVDAAGPAYAAGLRDNMRLLRLDLSEGGDARVPLVYRALDGDKERTIQYLPEGKRRVSLQELKLAPDPDAATQKACLARLSGSG